jgi:hypothetical protein
MADFSKYETPAPEWVKLQQQKVPSSELPTSTVDARDVYNVARAKLQKDFYGIAGALSDWTAFLVKHLKRH